MKKKCLIVDDDITTCFMLKVILEEHFVCDIAINGEKALCSFEKCQLEGSGYDLVCLDMNMPGINGLDVLKQIREAEAASPKPDQETRVIIISSDNTPATVLSSFFAGGASSYITKPVKRQKLLDELKKLELM